MSIIMSTSTEVISEIISLKNQFLKTKVFKNLNTEDLIRPEMDESDLSIYPEWSRGRIGVRFEKLDKYDDSSLPVGSVLRGDMSVRYRYSATCDLVVTGCDNKAITNEARRILALNLLRDHFIKQFGNADHFRIDLTYVSNGFIVADFRNGRLRYEVTVPVNLIMW